MLKNQIPVLPLRDIVVFPNMVAPLFVGRDQSVNALNHVMKGDKKIFLLSQKNSKVDNPNKENLYSVGTVASVPPQGGRKHPQQEFLQVDTSNILFICGGAFSGLEEIINYRLKGTAIGFNSKLDLEPKKTVGASLKKLENQDLLKFGMIQEFIGRLPVITTLSELDEDMLIRIMTQPKNAIVKQFESLMKMDGVKLEIKEDALKEIAKLAVSQNTGARGLRSIIEDSLMDLMYKVPDQKDLYKVVINKDVIAKKSDPILIYSNKENNQKLMSNNS